MFADVTTVANLELLRNIRDPRSEHTLYGILNTTKTRMGSRLLRVNILQPPCGMLHYKTHLYTMCLQCIAFYDVLVFFCLYISAVLLAATQLLLPSGTLAESTVQAMPL